MACLAAPRALSSMRSSSGRVALQPAAQCVRSGRHRCVRVCGVAEFLRTAPKEAILFQKFAAHTSSLAATLVLADTGGALRASRTACRPGQPAGSACRIALNPPQGATGLPSLRTTPLNSKFSRYPCPADGSKRIATSSLDKTLALWSSQVRGCRRCQAGRSRATPAPVPAAHFRTRGCRQPQPPQSCCQPCAGCWPLWADMRLCRLPARLPACLPRCRVTARS